MYSLLIIIRDIGNISIPEYTFLLITGLAGIYLRREYIPPFLAFTITPNMSMTFASVAFIILICIFLFHLNSVYFGKWALPILVLFVIELSSAFYGNFVFLEYVKLAAILILVGILIHNKNFNSKPLITVKCFLIGMTIGFISVLIQTLKVYSINEFFSFGKRLGKTSLLSDDYITSVSLNPNTIGMFAAIGLSIIICIIKFNKLLEKKYNKLFVFTIMFFLIFMGFASMSKAFFINLAIILLIYLYESRKKINNLFKKVTIVISFLIVGIFIFNKFFPSLSNSIFQRFTVDDFSSGRIDIFYLYNDVFANNHQWWLLGSGIQNYQYKAGISDSIHNAIQQVYFTWGILGLVIVVVYFINIFNSVLKKIGKNQRIFTFVVPLIVFLIAVQTSRIFSSFYTILLIIPIHSALNLNFIYVKEKIVFSKLDF